MCGFVAVLCLRPVLAGVELERRARNMAARIAHRGPDGEGVWSDAQAGVALAHRRLAIVDLSPAGAQPMTSASRRWTIVFNGEIYNHRDLRAALPDRQWRGHSDTEVLLEAIDAWGLDAALERSVGMFGFALWDAHARELFIARDRLGEKPVYYGLADDAVIVASELKALEGWPGFSPDIDRTAIDDLMRRGCVHAPRSIYRQVRKLLPASVLAFTSSSARSVLDLTPRRWWSIRPDVDSQARTNARNDAEVAIERLDALLRQALAGQMVADVPVGAFLSGGIDSSTVVALMQAQASRPVHTFSIGFAEEGYDEAQHARAVASHLGTRHTELYVSPDDARAVVPRLPAMFDEPFADSSQIPTYLVAAMARRHVTVSLSGDGGDELFGGYNRYLWAERIWKRMAWVPVPARRAAAAAARAASPARWDRAWRLLPRRWQLAQPGDKLHKLAGLAATGDGRAAYDYLIAQYRGRSALVVGRQVATPSGDHGHWKAPGRSLADNMMLADLLGYLPDDILTKVDRATMAVSLESRAPFLDHRLVEFAFSLPLSLKIRGRSGKWLLRKVLERYVPTRLTDRPKMGFGVPIDAWLRGPLKPWAEALLDPARLTAEGWLEAAPLMQAWQEHQSGRQNHQHFLWNALMFQSWLEARRAA
ncbi:MAG: asparagine synthase (glutamine-hydrolyzing) [Burkholderiales bacterium]|nr:asparagine synthase (glutamine-hydrolyzing) [Burkholderiales bacterium]